MYFCHSQSDWECSGLSITPFKWWGSLAVKVTCTIMLLLSLCSTVSLSHRIGRKREGYWAALTHGHNATVTLPLQSWMFLHMTDIHATGVFVGSEAWVFQYGSNSNNNRNSLLGIFFFELEMGVETLGAHLYLTKAGGAWNKKHHRLYQAEW